MFLKCSLNLLCCLLNWYLKYFSLVFLQNCFQFLLIVLTFNDMPDWAFKVVIMFTIFPNLQKKLCHGMNYIFLFWNQYSPQFSKLDMLLQHSWWCEGSVSVLYLPVMMISAVSLPDNPHPLDPVHILNWTVLHLNP